MRDMFYDIVGRHICREGREELLFWLTEETDFFTAPASTRHHGAYEGGLLVHSLNVYHRLRQIAQRELGGLLSPGEEETVAVIALFHDLCKVNCYTPEIRRRKDPDTGRWEELPGYTRRDPFPLGHGEKSLYLLARHLPLKEEEALAIRWHMGAYDHGARGGSSDLTAAMARTRWVWMLHQADMSATWLDERKEQG